MVKEKLKSSSEIMPGPLIPESATTLRNKTGGWRFFRPVLDKDKCTGCLICWVLCPDASIKRKKTDKRFSVHVDYDYCKGCGICAAECPVNAIEMDIEG